MPSESRPKKACCMISEILIEAGLDRKKARQIRRQILEGVILLCQWQLERMDESRGPGSGKKARKVAVE